MNLLRNCCTRVTINVLRVCLMVRLTLFLLIPVALYYKVTVYMFQDVSFCSLKFLQEKEHSIPLDDLGRDVASVAVLQRKHEAFENEASALGAQVRVKGDSKNSP